MKHEGLSFKKNGNLALVVMMIRRTKKEAFLMIKELKEMVTNGFYLFSFVFAISAALTTPVAILFIVANYLDGNL